MVGGSHGGHHWPPGSLYWDGSEWATVLAYYARANDWAGIPVGLTRPLREEMVSSRVPTH